MCYTVLCQNNDSNGEVTIRTFEGTFFLCKVYVYDSLFIALFTWRDIYIYRKNQKATPVFLSGESEGQRSLVGYSP